MKHGALLTRRNTEAEVQRRPESGDHLTKDQAAERWVVGLQRQAGNRATAGLLQQVSRAISSPGSPLPEPVRARLESRFGRGLEGVRVHTGAEAARSAEQINAEAYTVGSDIVFAPGMYQPMSPSGQRLLAHEASHAVQQTSSLSSAPGLAPDTAAEAEADRVADSSSQGGHGLVATSTGVGIARQFRSRDVPNLSNEALQNEIDMVRARLEEPAGYPERGADEQYYTQLMQEHYSRQMSPASEGEEPVTVESISGQSLERPAASKQYSDLIGIAQERGRYAVENARNARQIMQEWQSGQISAEVAEERAVASRRQMEASTRARLPGPEPAQTLNEAAARRNVQKYGDPLGYRDPAHVRAAKPKATTGGIIRSSGRPNVRVTGAGVAGGALGTLGGILAVQDLAEAFAGVRQVELEGLDPADYPVGHEFKEVHLGEQWYGTIRVDRNIIGRRKFYLVDVYILA